MATGSRRLPMFVESNTGKVVVGDGNDYEHVGLPEYTGEGDAQMVVGKTNPVTGKIEYSIKETGGTGQASFRAATCLRAAMQSGMVSNANYHLTHTLPDHFDAVRIGVFNIAASTYPVKAIVAPSAFAGQYQTIPYRTSTGESQDNTIDGATSLWRSVTWGGGNATATLNTTANAANPALTWSDWVACSSLERLDVPGALPLLMVRVFTPASGVVDIGLTQDAITAAQDYLQETNSGYIWRADFIAGGDAVGTPGNWNASVARAQGGAALGVIVEVRFRNPVVSVMTVGDSTFHGIGAQYNLGWAAQAFANAGIRVTHSNIGWSGQTSAQYYARFSAQLLADMKPSVVIYELATPNDSNPFTPKVSSEQRAKALAVIDACREAGVKCIISTPMPISASAVSAATQAEFTAQYNFAMGFDPYSGVVGMDLSALHVAGSPGQWNPAYGPVTLYHPNEAATQEVIAPAALLAVRKLYSI